MASKRVYIRIRQAPNKLKSVWYPHEHVPGTKALEDL